MKPITLHFSSYKNEILSMEIVSYRQSSLSVNILIFVEFHLSGRLTRYLASGCLETKFC